MGAQNFLEPRKFAENSTFVPHEVGGSDALAWGSPVKKGSSDNLVVAAGADDFDAIGVIAGPGGGVGTTYAVGADVQVAYFTGGGVIPVVVGTGGATRGKPARLVATGFTDSAAALASGATTIPLFGVFDASGDATNVVGLAVGRFERIIT